MNKKIVMLCSDCFSTVTLYNRINGIFPIQKIIVEQPFRGSELAKRRIKKLGYWKVGGQVLFNLAVVPVLRKSSRKRIQQVISEHQLDETPLPGDKIIHVPSVNDDACLELLKQEKPDLVIVNGTRIISKRILESTQAVFINMHTGITPQYRGVHGGYWALVQDDQEHCGVTVHLVDKGIDTGEVLYQEKIDVNREDNFVTYPYLQFAKGIPLVQRAVEDYLGTGLRPFRPKASSSRLWSHPTIWNYLYQRIFRNKK